MDCYFFFSSRRRHTRFDCDWSSDVCSSDLPSAEARATACPRRSWILESLVTTCTRVRRCYIRCERTPRDRKSTRLNSSHSQISYAVFCLKKKSGTPPGNRHLPREPVHRHQK